MQFDQKSTSECAFHVGDMKVCSSSQMIQSMRDFLRTAFPEKVIKDDEHVIDTMKELVKCESEACVLTKHSPFIEFIGKANTAHEVLTRLKPPGPSDNDDLLSNFNIDDVLEQFAKKYPGFVHIPFQMRDFQEQGTKLATIDLAEEYKKGMKSFGCILNTDWSSGGGYHWYAIFGDFSGNPITIEYYNTSGNYPLPETEKWLTKTKYTLGSALGKPVSIIHVLSKGIQKNDVDCGVYALHYIWSRLEKHPYTAFSDPATAPNDSLMKKARQHLFRPVSAT
jgi:hypothetical protein